MLAIAKSSRQIGSSRRLWAWTIPVLAAFHLVGVLEAFAELSSADRARFAAETQKTLVVAQKRYMQEPTNVIAAWELGRAGFDRAEFATNDTERATLAEQFIAICRRAVARDPKCAPAHYYLGLNLGQLARTKLLGALKIVDEMERVFKTSRALDERFDHAGADHNLGLLYRDTPSSISIGDRAKARKHLERAVELSPDFPENRLSLAEAYLKWREKKLLQKEMAALEQIWPVAKTNLSDPYWESAWLDWQERRQKLRQNAGELLKP